MYPHIGQIYRYVLYDLYDIFPLYDLDLPGKANVFLICMICIYDLAHPAGWEPYNLHDPGR